MKYTVIIEEGNSSFGAYVPDLPGCIATAESKHELLKLIKEAIAFHIEGLKEEGGSIPQPHFDFAEVEINAA
jgi:predicted RNase H-like HicB family nuclease